MYIPVTAVTEHYLNNYWDIYIAARQKGSMKIISNSACYTIVSRASPYRYSDGMI